MTIVMFVLGLALLFLGRRLFWVFVGGAGFVAGMLIAGEFVQEEQEWIVLAAAIAGGVLGALLSILLQRVAIGIAGFFAGGYVLFTLATELGYSSFAWVAFVIGAVIGAFLVLVLFDWALIVLSSLTGAILVTESFALAPEISLALFAVTFLAGLAVQAGQLKTRKQPQKSP